MSDHEDFSDAQEPEAPFDDPKADIILRSADDVEFRTFKSLLSFASPFFEGMFGLPATETTQDEVKDGLVVVKVRENSAELRSLLLFCHPGYAPSLHNLDDISQLLGAALQYEMVGIARRAGDMLKPFITSHPLRTYCIAWHYKLEPETRAAARELLLHPIFPRPYVKEMEILSAAALQRLEEYHYRCGKAAKAVATGYGWMERENFIQFDSALGCHYCAGGQTLHIANGGEVSKRQWWLNYMQEAAVAVSERPRGATVKGVGLLHKTYREATACTFCCDRVFAEMEEFTDMFSAEVERAISIMKVKLPF